ncbi:DUF927 domain-containing protein [Escherichia coli]
MKAPNLKLQQSDKMTEVIIFAGSDAWSHAKEWEEWAGKEIAGDNTPPVILGPKQLQNLNNIEIIDKGRHYARVYRAGEISEKHLLHIATLISLADVKELRIYRSFDDREPENLTARLPALKQDAESGKSIVMQGKAQNLQTSRQEELKPRIEAREEGVYWVTPKLERSGEIIRPEEWLCNPVEMIGEGVINKEHYRVMRWKSDVTGETVTAAIPCGDIGDNEGWKALKRGGLKVTANKSHRSILANWMQLEGSHGEWQLSTTSGWHFGSYIMPDGQAIGESEKPILFTGKTAAVNGYSAKGTAESWRNSVARLANGNPSMMIAVAASLAAPIIGIIGADSFGLHLFESSTAGKTTAQSVASSIWGNPEKLRLSWYGTALGMANEAEAHHDGLLPLDEIGQAASARDVYESAYTIFNGLGKLQGAKDGGNRELRRWRTVAISTGEVDLETFLKKEGVTVKAGQLIRLLNVPMQKAQELHEFSNGKDHADALKESWSDNHGAAAREWIKWLAAHQQEVKDAAKESRNRWRKLVPEDYGEQSHRAAERFSIMETALELSTWLTGWDAAKCRAAVEHNFSLWVDGFGTGNKDHEQIIYQATEFINRYGESNFLPLPADPERAKIQHLYGYRTAFYEKEKRATDYYVFRSVFEEEIAKGFNKNTAAAVLYHLGWLKKSKSEEGWTSRTPRLEHKGGKRERVYHIHIDFSAEDEDQE